jgi:hypothetical protein
MSLGSVGMSFKGDAPPRVVSSASHARNSVKKNENVVDNVVTFPDFKTCSITSLQIFLIISTVAALWTVAIGVWQIKYYVECNQGIITC